MPTHLPVATERFRIASGLEVILSEDKTVPLVAVDMVCHAGSKDDPPGRAGLAHLCEHLMFEGTLHIAPYEFFTRLADASAANVGAQTTTDITSFYETVPSNRIDLAMWLESDRMAFASQALNKDKLEKERRIVVNELRERFQEEPYGMVDSYIWTSVFPAPHPYDHPVIGDEKALNAVTLDDVRSFFKAAYAPSNCTLALVGDLSSNDAHDLATKYFGSIPSGSPIRRPAALPPSWVGEKQLVIEADVPRARVVIAWPVVPRFAPGSAELAAGAPSLNGWLYKELVDDEKLATSVNARMAPRPLGSLFEVVAEVANGKAPQAVLEAIDQRLHLIRGPHARFDWAQFAITRARLLAEPLRAAEGLASRAALLQLYNDEAGTPDFADSELAARKAVLVEDVRKALYDLLRWDRRVVAFVNPRPGAPLAGRLASAP
jgi:predicted Zn-dependent peptidase